MGQPPDIARRRRIPAQETRSRIFRNSQEGNHLGPGARKNRTRGVRTANERYRKASGSPVRGDCFAADSGKEREKILVDARRDMERLVDQSRQEVDRIARGIERDIKAKIADAVIDRAGHTLETQMTEDDQKRVVVRFLSKV